MPGWLGNTSSWLELVLNIVEAIALIVSIITFLYLMFNKFSIGLRRILSPLGLGPFGRLHALFICQRSQNKKRYFIEYAIMMTGGIPMIRKDWKSLISSFKSFYSKEEDKTIYSIKNCTLLTTQPFSNSVARYFKYFNIPKVKKAFGIQGNLGFIMEINVEEAYAMPTCLLNGLLSSYEGNYDEFIKQYVSTAYQDDKDDLHKILPDELFYTFNWLLWGPSYELEYRDGLWSGLCQISYGDESISFPAIADTTKNIDESDYVTVANRLREIFIENEKDENGRYGALISARIQILDEIPFYKTFEHEINPHNAYFFEKIKKDELPFGIKIVDFIPITNYKMYKYYATAYVWALFIEESDEEELFRPEKCVAFYEHSNIADKQTYQFLIDSVINKSLNHFRRLFLGEKYKDRKYRFLLAMNDNIASQMFTKYQEMMEKGDAFGKYLKSHITFDVKYSPAIIFRSFDEYFLPNQDIEFIEVSLEDKKTLVGLGEFYTDIYMDVFPIEDERETFDNLLKYLRLNKENGGKDYQYHILLARDNNSKIIGGCVFDYFIKTNSAVIEFIAVREEKQSGGFGTLIYNKVVSILNNDAIRHKQLGVDHIICEVNNPEFAKKGDPMKYLYFWDKHQYHHLNMNYIQPPLSEGKDAVTQLWLIYASPKLERDHNTNKIIETVDKKLVFDVISDFMKYAMEIKNPLENEYYQKMNEDVKTDSISLSDII